MVAAFVRLADLAVAVAVQLRDDSFEPVLHLFLANQRVAVGIKVLEGAHGHRLDDLVEQSFEFLQAQIAILVGVVFGEAVGADLLDLFHGQLAVVVLVRHLEEAHNRHAATVMPMPGPIM